MCMEQLLKLNFVLVKNTQNILKVLIVHAWSQLLMWSPFFVLTCAVHCKDRSSDCSNCCNNRCNWYEWFIDHFNDTRCCFIICKDVNTKEKRAPVQNDLVVANHYLVHWLPDHAIVTHLLPKLSLVCNRQLCMHTCITCILFNNLETMYTWIVIFVYLTWVRKRIRFDTRKTESGPDTNTVDDHKCNHGSDHLAWRKANNNTIIYIIIMNM